MTIDTLEYVKKLEAAGVDRQEAEAHAQAIREMLALATKVDIDRLAQATKAALETAVAKLDARIGNEVAKLEARISDEGARSTATSLSSTPRSTPPSPAWRRRSKPRSRTSRWCCGSKPPALSGPSLRSAGLLWRLMR
jgi:hypothetical protein